DATVSDVLDDDEQSQARVGSQVNGKWTLERLIGIGGMAAVYEGTHRNGARAAVKVLHPSYARRPDVRARFIREGYAANRVSHSGAVRVLDDDIIQDGAEEGTPFLVMELLEGSSIEDRIEKGPPISEVELLSIMRAILDVLEVAHKAGVVHRDIKPENLFLARNPDNPDAPPRIKILDFGLARVQEKGSNKTVVGLAIGTPSYMPPEQASGRIMEIDARSDLFALGATCFRVMANRTVHPADGPVEICQRMASEPAPKLRSVAPNVSKATAAVIDRALMFDRKDRWPNAAAMRAGVDKAIDELGGQTIAIESGIIDVSENVEPRHKLKTSTSEAVAPPAPAREPTAKIPMKTGSWFRTFVWLVIIAGAIVGGKIAYDRFGKTMLANAMDGGLLAPLTSDSGAPEDAAPDAHTSAPSVTPSVVPTHSAPKQHHDAGPRRH
ncbi:MAG TPA: serine/threonine-protein kinase, partial [Polyangiaceae bacterium]